MSTPRSKQEIAILKYEIKLFSDQLATYARLDDPLPPGVEMSMDEERESTCSAFVVGVLSYAHRQLRKAQCLKPYQGVAVWSRFCADHLPALATAVSSFDLKRQRTAGKVLLAFLSLIPYNEPYFVRFIRKHPAARDLPNNAAKVFIEPTFMLPPYPPSNPGHYARFFSMCIYQAGPANNRDSKSCFDEQIRHLLAGTLQFQIRAEVFKTLEEKQRQWVEALFGAVEIVHNEPQFINFTHAGLLEMDDECAEEDCKAKRATLTCSRCRTVVYCNAKCQNLDWTKGHNLRCFPTSF